MDAASALRMRALLHEADAAEHGEEAPHPPELTQSLRVAAIFIILATSLMGSIPPIVAGARLGDGRLALLLKALGTGVILALGYVHCYNDTIHDLEGVLAASGSRYAHYPLAGVLVLGGSLMMMFLDVAMRYWGAASGAAAAALTLNVTVDAEAGHKEGYEPASGHGGHGHGHDAHDHKHGHDHGHGHGHEHGHEHGAAKAGGHAHGEVCMHGTALVDACNSNQPWKARFSAYLLEIGCVFHSIIIGVALGMTTNYDTAVALLIALAFHQFLEGLALGTVVNKASFGRWRSLAMATTYSLTCPVGIAIGIAALSADSATSLQISVVKGVFNGVSAGILLYVGFSMAAEDFSREDVVKNGRLAAAMCACILLAGTLMSLLAMWA